MPKLPRKAKSIQSSRRGKSKKAPVKRLRPVDITRLERESDPAIRLAWVDRMEVSMRSDIPVGTLRFYSAVGDEKLTEASRIQTSVAHMRQIVDVLCRCLDYYPSKPKA